MFFVLTGLFDIEW